MTKHELLQLLDDAEVQRKILRIVNEPTKNFSTPTILEEPSAPDEKFSRLEGENNPSEAQQRVEDLERQVQTARLKNSQLEIEKNSALQRAATAERQLGDLRSDNFRLKNNLSEAQRRVEDLERQIQNAQYKNSRLESSLSQSERSSKALQSKLAEWQETFTREQQRAKTLQQDLDAANRKISDLEGQLQQRFARGWELFQKYQSVGSHARQLLQGVFTRDNFMSFICGGAQSESLEKIWDVLRECVMNSRQHDAEILCEVFEYSLELVNSSRGQGSYSILPVNVGDRFDSDIHTEAPGSRAQGRVAQVYLPGFRNDYNRRIIRKSIVQVS